MNLCIKETAPIRSKVYCVSTLTKIPYTSKTQGKLAVIFDKMAFQPLIFNSQRGYFGCIRLVA